MKETFDEVIDFIDDFREDSTALFYDLWLFIRKLFLVLTFPIWSVPYFIKYKKGDKK